MGKFCEVITRYNDAMLFLYYENDLSRRIPRTKGFLISYVAIVVGGGIFFGVYYRAWIYFVLIFLLVLFMLFFYRWYIPVKVRLSKKYNPLIKTGETIFSFYPDRMEVQNSQRSWIWPYLYISRVTETNDYFFIDIPTEPTCILDKRSFTMGSPDQLSAFFQKELPRNYRRLKQEPFL